MTYYVRFHTGAGDEEAATLEEAKKLADEGAAYTQQSISIEDEDGAVVLTRPWIGVAYDADSGSEDPIDFGQFGYYADWQEGDPVSCWFDAHPGGIPGYTI